MNRDRKEYFAYLDAAKSDKLKIPYSTLRRWRLKGKLNEDQLKKRGVTFDHRKSPSQRKKGQDGTLQQQGEDGTLQQQREDPITPGTSQDSGLGQNSRPSSPSTNDLPNMPGTSQDSELGHNSRPSSPSNNDPERTQGLLEDTLDCSNNVESDDSHSVDLSSDFSSVSSGSVSEADFSMSDDDLVCDSMRVPFMLKSKFIGSDVLNTRLHPNLNATKFEALLMILHLYMRHKMSDVFLLDLLTYTNMIVGVEGALPVSKYLFHKLFLSGSKPTVHFYCPNCSIYLGHEDLFKSGTINCEECDWSNSISSHNGNNYFLTMNLREQIQDVLSRPGIQFVSRCESDSVIADIMDGKDYKFLTRDRNILSNPNALTITFNTDGSPVFKSGPNSLWPLHFYINEINVLQRFKADNILLGGSWFGNCEPNIQVFMKPFIDEIKELQNDGVIWKKSDGTIVESPVYAISCCCDSVAKPKVQCHLQFNGAFACGYCLHPNPSITVLERVESRSGIVIQNSTSDNTDLNDNSSNVYRRKKVMRYTRGHYEMRTNQSLREHMKLACESPFNHVMGATGVSILCDLKYFDVVYGFPIDYMHAILLGTVKRLVGYWLDTTNHSFPYYIGKSVQRLDSRLKSITLPTGFRPPRPLSDRVHWKANEWRAFLLYYGLVILMNILQQPYYEHFKKLVTAIYTLSKDSISYDEVDSANNILHEFVWEYQDLYGEINMVYNVHITGHLAQLVAKKGPLWACSAFPFESGNGRLVSLAMGTKGVATQISRKYLMTKGVTKLLCKNYTASEEVLKYCSNLLGYKYLHNASKGQNNETMLGKPFYFTLDDDQKQIFRDKRFLPVPDVVLTVRRIVLNGQLYHSRLTTKQRKACDSCVRLTSGEFALIDLVICNEQSGGSVSFLVTTLNIATDSTSFLPAHIKQCSIDSFGEQTLITSKGMSKKCIYFSCNDKRYVTEFANFYETD